MWVSCTLLIQRPETGPSASETHFAQAVRKVPPATAWALGPCFAGASCPAALVAAAPKPRRLPRRLPRRTPVLGTYAPAQLMCSEKCRLFLRMLPEHQQAVKTSPVTRPPTPPKQRLFLLQVARLLSGRPGGSLC